MRFVFASLLLAWVAGCGVEPLWLGFPPDVGAASMVLATPIGEQVELMALDLDQSGSDIRIEVDSEQQNGRDVYALLFDSPLSAYRVAEGILENPLGTTSSLALLGDADALFGPTPERVFAARVYEAEGAADWESIEEAPAWIAQRRVHEPEPTCPTFVPNRETVSVDGFVAYAFAIQPKVVYMRIWDGPAYVVTPAGATEVSAPGPVTFSAAFLETEDLVWLGDENGRVWTARPTTAELLTDFKMAGDTGLRVPIESIAVRFGHVFAVAYDGTVAHFDRTSWRRVANVGRDRRGDIVATSLGEAMLLTGTRTGLNIITGDGARFDDVNGVAPKSIAEVPGIGTVVGTENGGFYRRELLGWTAIEGAAQGFWSAAMLPYDGGFVFHLASGVGGFHHPTLAGCEDLFATGLLIESRLVPQGRDVAVIHLTSDAKRTVVTRLERR